MHRALLLEDILHIIFSYCYPERLPDRGYAAADLVALVSTCRVFKEPALDALWMELKDETPLARCLPGTCVSSVSESGRSSYRFKRRLKASERETVKCYTRRVRVLSISYPCRLDLESLKDLCLPSMTAPLFPNIRRLFYFIVDQNLPFIHHIVSPTLKVLYVNFAVSNISSCGSFVRSLGPTCPNVRKITITCSPTLGSLGEVMVQHIRHWSNLQEVECSTLSLDLDALLHLSSLPGLTVLSFMLSRELTNQIASSNQLLVFPALQQLFIQIRWIVPISELLMHMRLPAVTSICTIFNSEAPPRKLLRSFLMALQKACTSQTTKFLAISHFAPLDPRVQSSGYALTLGDLHPFTALNFTHIMFDLDWIVNLTDNDFLQIASMCPRLVSLVINENHGWRATGVTPAGLAQFLQRCPFLNQFCIVLDTRDYTSHALKQTRDDGASPMPTLSTVNVADSIIGAESIPALADFFAEVFPQLVGGRFYFQSWEGFGSRRRPDREVYMKRWQDVCALAKQKLLAQSQ